MSSISFNEFQQSAQSSHLGDDFVDQINNFDLESLLNSFSPPSLVNSPFSITSSPDQLVVTPALIHDNNDMLNGTPLFGSQVKAEPNDYTSTLSSESVFEGFSSLFNNEQPQQQSQEQSPKQVSPQQLMKSTLSPQSSSVTPTSSSILFSSTSNSNKRSNSRQSRVSFDDPIQPRHYVSSSQTSRKRVPVAFENKVCQEGDKNKRQKKDNSEINNDIPEDIQDAIENKRRQNTLAARKSRERKRKELESLELKVEELEKDKQSLSLEIEKYKLIEVELNSLKIENDLLKNRLNNPN